MNGWVSPRLGIRFDGTGEALRIHRPDGVPFFSFAEINQMLTQERQRAEQAEQQRAEMEAPVQQYREREARWKHRFGDLEG